MSESIVKVGRTVLNVKQVSAAHWDGDRLFVYLVGGRFIEFGGQEAQLVWQAVTAIGVDLDTGEVK